MSSDTPKILAIVGPTASRKSELAMTLAEQLHGEIICTDSMQVYRQLDIGTAKPALADRQRVPHHQLDKVDPDEHYSAGTYEQETVPLIQHLIGQGKLPILVGGTGLYYRALLYGMSKMPTTTVAVRHEVENWHQRQGLAYCYQQLQERDPLAAKRLHPHDTARILRALEVLLQTGHSLVQFQQENPFTTRRYRLFSTGYQFERDVLYQRINQRTEAMLKAGWIAEVENLLREYPPDLKPLKAIGYLQIVQYLNGHLDQTTMKEQIQQKTRNYAKRQLTWFRKEQGIHWFEAGREAAVLREIQTFLQQQA